MNSKNENKFSSYLSVRQVCNDNKSLWMGIPAFVSAFNRFEQNIEKIETAAGTQRQAITGLTKDKKALREQLISATLVVSKAMVAYAETIGNRGLQDSVSISRSSLELSRDSVCHQTCLNLHILASEEIAGLGDFGVTPAMITELKQLVDSYELAIAKPRNAVAKRKDASAEIERLMDDSDAILKRIIDNLMERFKDTDPGFHNKYTTTREILDYGIKHTTLAGVVKDKRTNLPLAKVEVSLVFMENEEEKIETTQTNKEGEFLFEHVQAREYEVRFSLAGYVRGIEKSDIRRGKTNRIEIALEKTRIS